MLSPPFEGAAKGLRWLKQKFHTVIIHNTLLPQMWIKYWLQEHDCYADELWFCRDLEKLTLADQIDILIDDNPQVLCAWNTWPRNLRVIKAAMIPWNEDIVVPKVMDDWENIRVVMDGEFQSVDGVSATASLAAAS